MNRKTASTINDQELDQLYGLLERYVALADVTHKYRIMGGHDSIGANLTCAGCALRDEIRDALLPAQRPAAGTGSGAATPDPSDGLAPSRPHSGPWTA